MCLASRVALLVRTARRGSRPIRYCGAKIKLWQDNFAVIDLLAAPELPPEELFGKIAAGIDADLREVPVPLTKRAGTGEWEEMSPGVTFTVLFEDLAARRRSILGARLARIYL